MEFNTRVYSASGRKVWTVVLVFSLAILAVGIYLGFIKSGGYVRSTGVVVSLKEEESYDSDLGKVTYYYPTVKHTVNGREYTGTLDISTGAEDIGSEVKILYDPQDPSKINSYSPGIVIYIFAVGGILFALAVFKLVREKRG